MNNNTAICLEMTSFWRYRSARKVADPKYCFSNQTIRNICNFKTNEKSGERLSYIVFWSLTNFLILIAFQALHKFKKQYICFCNYEESLSRIVLLPSNCKWARNLFSSVNNTVICTNALSGHLLWIFYAISFQGW